MARATRLTVTESLRSGSLMVWFTSANVVGMAVGTSAAVGPAEVGAEVGDVVVADVVEPLDEADEAEVASPAGTIPLGAGLSAPLPEVHPARRMTAAGTTARAVFMPFRVPCPSGPDQIGAAAARARSPVGVSPPTRRRRRRRPPT